MLKKILPSRITDVIAQRLNVQRLYEMRMRSDRAVTVNYNGNFYYLCGEGLTEDSTKAIRLPQQALNEIIVKASNYSLYTVNRNICSGFITIEGGIRIGVAGEYVWEEDRLKTIKNFSGLTIRVPHEVRGCCDKLLKYIIDTELLNTLIISPPACGKTTMLRDISRTLSARSPRFNILLVDERSEIAAAVNGVPQLDVGNNTDVVSNSSKTHGILHGIRSMNPYVIITDELAKQEDIEAAYSAACSGVRIIATVHAYDQYDLMNKTYFDRMIKNRLFARYAVLSDKPCIGSLSGVYDENFNKVY